MNHRQRFVNFFTGQPYDRPPLLIFDAWLETKARWLEEGAVPSNDHIGVSIPGLDPDWEGNMWAGHDMVCLLAIGDKPFIEEENDGSRRIFCDAVGNRVMERLDGSCISNVLKYGLEPTPENWEHYKTFLDPFDPRRWAADWREKARAFAQEDHVLTFKGGSLYGDLRNFMGVEALSYLMYDDPDLLHEMIDHLVHFYLSIMERILEECPCDVAYIWEDCCGADGPLFSPQCYYEFFHEPYQKMIDFYHSHGVPLVLMDSDGKMGPLVDCWLDSGFDIIFPIEVGTWKESAPALRQKYGRRLQMMGGVDKHLISQGGEALRHHLTEMKETVEEGGFLPMPDHRISPECSYQKMIEYVNMYREIFG